MMDWGEEEETTTGELHARHLQDYRTRLHDKDDPNEREKEDVAGDKSRHRERGAEPQGSRISNDHAGGMDVEPEESDQRARNKCTKDGNIQLAWRIQERDHHVADPGEDHGAARESIEAVGQVHAVARGDDRNDRHRDPECGSNWDLAHKGYDERGKGKVLLDIDRGDDRDANLPEKLLSSGDPDPSSCIKPVIERTNK